jgi:tetratricopeptide (TPR) repeat protein
MVLVQLGRKKSVRISRGRHSVVTTPHAIRQPNHALRAARAALHLSQREFAALIRKTGDDLGEPNGCTARLVQKWESGEHATCRSHYRRALQEATSTPYNRLGFEDVPSVAAVESTPSRDVANTNPGDYFRYAMAVPKQADTACVAVVQTTVAQLFDIEHHTPARVLLPTVGRQLDDIAELLRGTAESELRERLVAHGGEAAALAGWLALDCGDTDTAHRYWDGAMAAARNTADGPLLACVLTYLSYAAMERDDPNGAWQLAHTATEHAGEEPHAQAWMNLRAAQAVARLGDIGSAQASLKLAREWALDIGPPPAPDDATPPWVRFVDRAYLWAMAADVLTRIGDLDNAYEAAVRAYSTLSSNRTKTRAVILTQVAYTLAYLGGTERAAEHAKDALELAEALELGAVKQRLWDVLALLPRPLDMAGRGLRRRLGSG